MSASVWSLACSEQVHAVALIDPGGDAAVEGSAARGGDDGDLAAAGLGVILLHGCFVRGELVLDLAALVAADAGKLFVGVVELVGAELELGFGYVKVVGVGNGAVGLFQGGGEGVDVGLIFLDHGLELARLFAGPRARRRSGCGFGERPGEERRRRPGRLSWSARRSASCARDCSSAETARGARDFDGLPGTLIDDIAGGALAAALRTEKRHVRHGAARPPGSRETEDEEGCGYRDCEAAKKLHLSTLHGWMCRFQGSQTGEACRI